jgi:membrane protein implicated in regulation of membrane protease activity
MENWAWILWSVLGVILIIAEIFTLGFVLFWFGLGAFAAALIGFLGFGFAVQFIVFAAVSTALTIMSRTIFVNYLSNDEENSVKIGMEALPGKIGTVTEASRGALQEAAVKVYGATWTAFPADGETILTEGEKVEVIRVNGSSIYVRRANRELPDWREKD